MEHLGQLPDLGIQGPQARQAACTERLLRQGRKSRRLATKWPAKRVYGNSTAGQVLKIDLFTRTVDTLPLIATNLCYVTPLKIP